MKILKNPQVFILLIFMAFVYTACEKASDDTTPPVITIIGANPVYSQLDSPYIDPGATAFDDADGDISSKIEVIEDVNIHVSGYNYYVYYNVTDEAGNEAEEKKRRVIVQAF